MWGLTRVTAVLLTLGFASAATALPQFGSPTPLNRPGYASTQLWDVNDAGTIVGASDSDGFVFRNGVFSTIRRPGSGATVITGLSADGETLVGISYADPNFTGGVGFIYSDGVFQDILMPFELSVETGARHISDSGRYITGTFIGPEGQGGYALDRWTGNWKLFEATPTVLTVAQGVNDAGVVTGSFTRRPPGGAGPSESGSFVHDLVSGGTTEYLAIDGQSFLRFRDINNAGLIVGWGSSGGFVTDLSDAQVFGPPLDNWSATAYGLNNNGSVVGYYTDGVTFLSQGWVSVAVPEPAAWALWTLGFAALGGLRRARSKA
jgi:hypothetical protein